MQKLSSLVENLGGGSTDSIDSMANKFTTNILPKLGKDTPKEGVEVLSNLDLTVMVNFNTTMSKMVCQVEKIKTAFENRTLRNIYSHTLNSLKEDLSILKRYQNTINNFPSQEEIDDSSCNGFFSYVKSWCVYIYEYFFCRSNNIQDYPIGQDIEGGREEVVPQENHVWAAEYSAQNMGQSGHGQHSSSSSGHNTGEVLELNVVDTETQ